MDRRPARLPSLAELCQRASESDEKGPLMTIILGFTSDEAVVLASDSQASFEGSTSKQAEFQKIFAVTLANGGSAIVAMSGDLDIGAYFLEMFEERLATADLERPRAVADAAEAAIKVTQTRLLSALREQGAKQDELQQKLHDCKCELLLGYLHEKTPFLYSVKLFSALASRITQPFEALGCGANIANLVLSGFPLHKVSADRALGLAAYAIQMCKDNDSGCSGRIQMGIATNEKGREGFIADKKWSTGMEAVAKEVQTEMKSHLWKGMRVVMMKHKFLTNDFDADPDSIEAMREKIEETIHAFAQRCDDGYEPRRYDLADEILASLGILPPKRKGERT
jgi:20S proteasome alpha/beta subunit